MVVPVDVSGPVVDRAFGFVYRGTSALVGVAFVVLYAFVLFPAASVRSGSPDNRILALQNSRTVSDFAAVLTQCSGTNENAVGIMKRGNLWRLDSSFPVIYGVAFAYLFAWSTGRRQPTRLDRWLFAIPFVAAAFDYIENALELIALRGINTRADVEAAIRENSLNAAAIFWQWASSRVKFALVAVSLGAIVITFAGRIVRLVRHRTNPIRA